MAASTTTIAQNIGVGLLKGIAGNVGALIFDSIFPPGAPSYFGQVYEEITKIIHQEITQNTIDTLNGTINGLKDWIVGTYTQRRNDKSVPKQDLFNMLSPKESNLTINVIGVLQEPNFAEPGFSVFMIAAGMHLAILQELAYVDPTTSDPHKSSYIASIEKYAKEYSSYATEMYNRIEGKRMAYIQFDENGPGYIPPAGQSMTFKWVDNFTNQQESWTSNNPNGFWNPPLAKVTMEALSSMEKHCGDVKQTLKTQLSYNAIADWFMLTMQPLPNMHTK